MRRFRLALQSVVAKEARAYGFSLVVWSTGAVVTAEKGMPAPADVLLFVGGVLAAQAAAILVAFGSPTRCWSAPSRVEYVWAAFHLVPVAAPVLLAWAAAAIAPGAWAYPVAPAVAVSAYQVLLAVESAVLSPEDQIEPATADASAARSDSSL